MDYVCTAEYHALSIDGLKTRFEYHGYVWIMQKNSVIIKELRITHKDSKK
jgi:hypothetical protein